MAILKSVFADQRIVRWLQNNQYHPRSDKHGKMLCRYFLYDLLNASPFLKEAAQKGKIVFNEDYKLGKGALRWTIDLVLGPTIKKTEEEIDRLILKDDPSEIWLALDAKSVMTEHGKARRNRQRDLNSLQSVVKHYYPNSIVGGLMLVNMSTTFKSPLRDEITHHRNIERLVKETIDIFKEIPRADILGGVGIEGVCVIVIDHTNDPNDATKLITKIPAPQKGEETNYCNFLQIIKECIETRYKNSLNDADVISKFEEMNFDIFIPKDIKINELSQTDYPAIAKNKKLMKKVHSYVKKIPTKQIIVHGDSRNINLEENSVHLVITSPPYWILKKYDPIEGQLGVIEDYDLFLRELDKVWGCCYKALVPGGRMAVVVGDVCLSRRKYGRHHVIPLHSSIQEHCRKIGFDNLAPIIWYKIANIKLEVEGSGRFLGKPYEPNAIVKNDVEYILFLRKPGSYRKPSTSQRVLSLISEEEHREYFQQIWQLPGASTRKHPAPFPLKLVERLVKMFSFVGDTVLDPFLGTGTTLLGAGNWGRNGIGFEIDEKYVQMSLQQLKNNIRYTDVSLIKN